MLRTSAESVFAYAGIRHRLTDLLANVTDLEGASTPVPACPEWCVTDVVAHLFGVERDILDGNVAEAGTAAWADDQVRRFSPFGLRQLVERWNETSPAVERMAGGFPQKTTAQFVFDACTHEHDIRGALDQPGGRDVDSVIIGMSFIEESLCGLVADRGLPGLELGSPLFTAFIGEEPSGARLSTTTFELFRTFGGRRAPSQIEALPWEGDPTPYLAVFGEGPLQPPALPLIE